MGAESGEITDRLVAAMNAGLPADASEAMDAAEAHRQHISRWFHDCTSEIHVGLGEMSVADPRFRANYEKVARGSPTTCATRAPRTRRARARASTGG